MTTETNQETAIIKVNPSIDQGVVALQTEALKLEAYAKNLLVTNDEVVKAVTNDLSIIARLKKAIEEKRKEYVTPINEHLKFINDTFKMITVPLESADKITRQKIMEYRAECDRKAREIAEINRMREEAAKREAKLNGTGEISEPLVIIETPPAPATTIRTDNGTLGTMQIWKFEVEDFSKLPDEYKMVDAVKLGKVVRAGLHNIAGVRVWAEDTLKVNAR